jgi:hypothetical protein
MKDILVLINISDIHLKDGCSPKVSRSILYPAMLEVAVAKALIKLVFPNPFARLDAAKTPDMAAPFILA